MVGDTHGFAWAVRPKLQAAKKLGADRILILGDFGIWQGHPGMVFLDEINKEAMDLNIKIYALGGNHENWPLWNQYIENATAFNSGFAYVRSNVLIAPKVHNFKWDNKRFFIAGGAVSIDRQQRVPGHSWWPEEILTDDELASVLKVNPEVEWDYLFTHDASDHTRWGYHLIPDPESQLNRQRIDKVIAHLKPRMQFHGHMHARYEWVNTASHGHRPTAFDDASYEWDGPSTLTYGFECNDDKYSWGLLDTERDQFYWPDKAYSLFSPTE